MTKVRVNIRTAVNNAAIRRERRHGRDYIIVPSATLPDNIVMNGSMGRVRYPAEEIEKSFRSLENTPAPLGHPTIEGAFVSASDPEGLVRGWIGAFNRNVRRENGRVWADKVIDVATASQLEGGKAVLSAIEKGEPISTSVGLYCMLTNASDDGADYDASDIAFDHDAILLGEAPAATPEQGVGMLVNRASDSQGNAIEVINSVLEDESERELNWAIDSVIRTVEREKRAPLLERIKSVIRDAVLGAPAPGGVSNAEEASMDKAQFDELTGKVEALATAMGGLDEKIASGVGTAVANALKPVTDQLAADTAARAAEADAKKAELVNKLVAAKLIDEEDAKDAPLGLLNKLAANLAPGKATLINGAFKPAGDKPGFKLPEGD